ncbi:hypothetical protein J4Q44_G00306380 [Coregonus suidteri]|uniref:Uncharacterized protein n=1 Tax=Coregonus suidteri TaxID=861788 RepID=A0AAN8KWC1_9TELE
MIGKGIEQEYVVVEVWMRGRVLVVVNYYNPCQMLDMEVLERVEGQERRICEWEVWEESTVGSDHYPIVYTVGRREEEVSVDGVGRTPVLNSSSPHLPWAEELEGEEVGGRLRAAQLTEERQAQMAKLRELSFEDRGEVLQQVATRLPGVMFDIMDLRRPIPGSPDRGQPCLNCWEMPTDLERKCWSQMCEQDGTHGTFLSG